MTRIQSRAAQRTRGPSPVILSGATCCSPQAEGSPPPMQMQPSRPRPGRDRDPRPTSRRRSVRAPCEGARGAAGRKATRRGTGDRPAGGPQRVRSRGRQKPASAALPALRQRKAAGVGSSRGQAALARLPAFGLASQPLRGMVPVLHWCPPPPWR